MTKPVRSGARVKDSFNSNFYITTATVIPLLYITLFLQGELIQNLAKRARRLRDENADALLAWSKKRRSFLVIYVCLAAVFAGLVAEVLSIWALFYRSDNIVMRTIVLWSVLGLLVLGAANPTITVVRNLYGWASRDTSDGEPDSIEGAEQRENGLSMC